MAAKKKSTGSRKTAARRSTAPPDAIAVLKEDHAKVKGLLESLEKTTERSTDRRQKLLAQIEGELKIHTQIEEEIFYPAFRDAAQKKEDKEIYFEALEEHHVVDLVMPEIDQTSPGADEFGAKAKVLKDLVLHHAEEEEKEMFPRARKVMERSELQELGTRLTQRKKQLKGETRLA